MFEQFNQRPMFRVNAWWGMGTDRMAMSGWLTDSPPTEFPYNQATFVDHTGQTVHISGANQIVVQPV